MVDSGTSKSWDSRSIATLTIVVSRIDMIAPRMTTDETSQSARSMPDPEVRPVRAGAPMSVAVTFSPRTDGVARNDSAQSRLDRIGQHVRLVFVVLSRR